MTLEPFHASGNRTVLRCVETGEVVENCLIQELSITASAVGAEVRVSMVVLAPRPANGITPGGAISTGLSGNRGPGPGPRGESLGQRASAVTSAIRGANTLPTDIFGFAGAARRATIEAGESQHAEALARGRRESGFAAAVLPPPESASAKDKGDRITIEDLVPVDDIFDLKRIEWARKDLALLIQSPLLPGGTLPHHPYLGVKTWSLELAKMPNVQSCAFTIADEIWVQYQGTRDICRTEEILLDLRDYCPGLCILVIRRIESRYQMKLSEMDIKRKKSTPFVPQKPQEPTLSVEEIMEIGIEVDVSPRFFLADDESVAAESGGLIPCQKKVVAPSSDPSLK